MAYTITIIAKKIDKGDSLHYRTVVSQGEFEKKDGKKVKRHLESDNTIIKEETLQEDIITLPSGKMKSEYLQGAVYAIHLRMFGGTGENDINFHQGLSIGEIKKISNAIVTAGVPTFYDLCVTHSGFDDQDAALPSDPSGTITDVKIKELVLGTGLFPELVGAVTAKDDPAPVLSEYIENTWIPANLPDSVTSLVGVDITQL